jgi:hypothetical protein
MREEPDVKMPQEDIARLSALIDTKLSEIESRTNNGELPSTSELNAPRPLIAWRETERELERMRELTRE